MVSITLRRARSLALALLVATSAAPAFAARGQEAQQPATAPPAADASPAPAAEKTPCERLRERFASAYAVLPESATNEERAAKRREIDDAASAARADRRASGRCLREMVADESTDPMVRYHVSSLLVEHFVVTIGDADDFKSLQVRAYTAVPFDRVNVLEWVTKLARRGADGIDTSEAGVRWLDYDPWEPDGTTDYRAYVAAKRNATLYLFGSMDEKFATPALARIAATGPADRRETAVWLLALQATPEAYDALRALDPNALPQGARRAIHELEARRRKARPAASAAPVTPPRVARKDFLHAFERMDSNDVGPFGALVQNLPDFERDAILALEPRDAPALRRVRRRIISLCTPRAIEIYNSLTAVLVALARASEPGEAPAATPSEPAPSVVFGDEEP